MIGDWRGGILDSKSLLCEYLFFRGEFGAGLRGHIGDVRVRVRVRVGVTLRVTVAVQRSMFCLIRFISSRYCCGGELANL